MHHLEKAQTELLWVPLLSLCYFHCGCSAWYTLPACVAVTWSRIKINSDILLRDLLLTKWSIFPGGDPPLPPQTQVSAAVLLLAGTKQPCVRRKRQRRRSVVPLAWLLEKFCCGGFSQFRSVPLIQFLPLTITPSLPPSLRSLHLLPLRLFPPIGRCPGTHGWAVHPHKTAS